MTTSYAMSGAYLGYPLDQLLHRECRVLATDRTQDSDKGILFTRHDDPGTGNIVIMGPPGSGKSTLGLHIARSCAARQENRCYTAYFSLECTPQETLKKAQLFWPENNFRIAASLPLTDKARNKLSRAESLYRLLVRNPDCRMCEGHSCELMDCPAREPMKPGCQKWPETADPQVMLMSLSPRPTTSCVEDHTEAFWNRYAQLEYLLAGAYDLRARVTREQGSPSESPPSANWILPLMVIDSLNMMAEGMPNRDQLLPLFHLFRKYETIGVFLVESSTPTHFDSTLADVVIKLTMEEDQGYSARYFEVVKSRYRNQVNGRHPYKTVPAPKGKVRRPPIPRKADEKFEGVLTPSGMIVLPSVHYAVLRGFFDEKDEMAVRDKKDEPTPAERAAWGPGGNEPGRYWGVSGLNAILPNGLRSGSAVLIEGPSGTFKTNLAATFLAAGLQNNERVLLIRLHDDRMIRPVNETSETSRADGPALSEDTTRLGFKWDCMKKLSWRTPGSDDLSSESWQELAPPRKATITVWQKGKRSDARLYEIDLKTGHLLAEEFIQFIRDIVIRQQSDHPITRVVLDDVSEIGVAYPFLRNSSTSGDILLPSLVHLMKDNHVDLVVTGTTGIHPLADDAVARTRAVADTVLRSRYVDVFGRKHVVIEGEGQIASAKKEDVESRSVPAIIENIIDDSGRRFRLTQDSLRGLVGFDQGRLYRPGIALQLFQETGAVHQRYNSDLLAMMRAAFASPQGLSAGQDDRRTSSPDPAVTLATFNSESSAAVHDGLEIFTNAEPMNATVVCSVDECSPVPDSLFVSMESINEEDGPLFKYYRNVLLLAYRTDILRKLKPTSWCELAETAEKLNISGREECPVEHRFAWDRSASETLTCAFLDMLLKKGNNSASSLGELLKKVSSRRRELASFGKLFSKILPRDDDVEIRPLEANAAIYLCWYSQLRELIAGNPQLAPRLKIVALPQGGFTGDWKIGVRSGSVSANLGRAVLEKLLSPTEDYKRFVQGVGLPCSSQFTNGAQHFSAWPFSQKDVTLKDILRIHERARSRRELGNYKQVRSVLYSAARQLAQLRGDDCAIDMIVEKLPTRVKQLEGARVV